MTTHKKCEVITCRRIIVCKPKLFEIALADFGQSKKVKFHVCQKCDKELREHFAPYTNNAFEVVDNEQVIEQIVPAR